MSNNTLDLRRHSREIKRNKWWILASAVAFALLAAYYWKHHMPEYTIHSVMLIEEDEDNGSGASVSRAGGISQMMRAFSIGGFGASSVDNERIIAETHTVLSQTIKDLGLNCTYVGNDGITRKPLYGTNLPIKVEAPDELFDTISIGLKMNIKLDGNKANIKVKTGFFKTIYTSKNTELPCLVKTPYGHFKVTKQTPSSHFKDIPNEITVTIAGNNALTEYYRKKIELDLYDKKADALEFTYKDACPQRGIDVLNTLMENYNRVRKNHKDEVSRKEIEFYDNRIASLAQELNDADNRMVNFKRQNNIVDIGAQATTTIMQSAANEQEAVRLQAEMEINKMILETLSKGGMMPVLGNEATASAITQYNELVATKQELEKSAKDNNEALISLNEKISATKKAITESAQKGIDASRIKLSQLNATTSKESDKMSKAPSQEKEYFNLLRDKELKNELFIFLMQRRESSKLQLTKNSSPSFIIDKAYNETKPSILKPITVTLILILMGILGSLLLILYIMKKSDRIKDAFDLNSNWEEKVFNTSTKTKDNSKLESRLREIRAQLFGMENVNSFYVYDITHNNNELLTRLIASITQTNKKVAFNRIKTIDDIYFNDKNSGNVKNDEPNNDNTYNIYSIATMSSLGEIYDKLENEANGLILLIKKGQYRRKQFNTFVANIDKKESIIIINQS